jgi:hypothetical protein
MTTLALVVVVLERTDIAATEGLARVVALEDDVVYGCRSTASNTGDTSRVE